MFSLIVRDGLGGVESSSGGLEDILLSDLWQKMKIGWPIWIENSSVMQELGK